VGHGLEFKTSASLAEFSANFAVQGLACFQEKQKLLTAKNAEEGAKAAKKIQL
jgi:hypothetical protein